MEVSNFEADKQYAKSETHSMHSDVQIETSSNFKSFKEEDVKMNSHEVIEEGSTYKSQESHHLIQVNDDDEEDVKMHIHEVIEEGSIYDSQGSHQLIQVKDDDEENMKENPGEMESSESWSSDIDSSTDWKEIIYYGAILMFIIVLVVMVTQMARTDEKKDVSGGSLQFEEEKRVVEEKKTFEEIPEHQNFIAAEAEEKKRTKDLTKKKVRIEDEKLRAAAKQEIHVTEDKKISTKPQKQVYTPSIEEDLEEKNNNAEAGKNSENLNKKADDSKKEDKKENKWEEIKKNLAGKPCGCVLLVLGIIIFFLIWAALIALHVIAFVVNFTSTTQQQVIYWSMWIAAVDAIYKIYDRYCSFTPIQPTMNNPWMECIYFVWNVFIAVLSFYSVHRESKKNWKHNLEGWWRPALISGYSALQTFIYPIYLAYTNLKRN